MMTLTLLFASIVSLNAGWSFTLDGEPPRSVDLPHDWSIEAAPFRAAPSGCAGGFYRAGKATYERTVDGGVTGGTVHFEAVYRDATVYVDGKKAAANYYGYTGFDVKIPEGKHQLKVTVDNSDQPNCRWYSGGGILRPVTFEPFEKGHVEERALTTDDEGGAKTDVRGKVVGTDLRAARRGRRALPKIEWSATTGFVIDGVPTLLHGACVHHDHGPLGAASYPDAELRKVRQLKAAGFNAVRCSHNPASEAFLDACDAEGLWVIQELCDDWNRAKTPGSYANNFARDWMKDLTWMVNRDKHHPCIIAWSIGNEILERTQPEAVTQAAAMCAVIKLLDPTRPVTEAFACWSEGQRRQQDARQARLDIVGYNYMDRFLDEDHRLYPNLCTWMTETFPCELVKNWRIINERPYVFGEFVWTGIDYLGESGIGCNYYDAKTSKLEHYQLKNDAWPIHGAYCGDIDLVGWRKPVSHQRETQWNPAAPTYLYTEEPDGWKGKISTTAWSVWPCWESWNYEGWEGKSVNVVVCSRQPEVALYLNDQLVGVQTNGAANAWTVKFAVPYTPGTLRAEGRAGAPRTPPEVTTLRTAGAPDRLVYTEEVYSTLRYVTATWVDKDGVVCPDATGSVDFAARARPGERLIGTCSADLTDAEPATNAVRKAWHARALGIFKKAPSIAFEWNEHALTTNGVPWVAAMGEMHYARVPRAEWGDYLHKMKAGGLDIVASYVFWNHHEWEEGKFDFTGNRDLRAFLEACEKEGLYVCLRLGPWAHGEAREGGFPDWLVEKGTRKSEKGKSEVRLRSDDPAYLKYVERFWREVYKQVDGHLLKQGGNVVMVQLENECRGPWTYFAALKKTAKEIGFDAPYWTKTGWPKMRDKVPYGELLPLFGDYADGFWSREHVISPGEYQKAFQFHTTRTSENIATEQLATSELGSDGADVQKYPYLTCELGGGMASSYQRRLVMHPMDAFAMAVVKLGSGSNLLGYYMYAGGTNPNDPKKGRFLNETLRGKFTAHNDLTPFSYEFQAPISEFGELNPHYFMLKKLHAFIHTYGREFANEPAVIVAPNEARRGRFVFHNDYIRGVNFDGEAWVGVTEPNGSVTRLVSYKGKCDSPSETVGRAARCALSPVAFRLVKPAGPAREIPTKPQAKGPAMPLQPEEADWENAAVYELEVPADRGGEDAASTLITLSYLGDAARLYVDDVPVADNFYNGLPMKVGLWRYPKGRLTLRILPWSDSPLIYVQAPNRPKTTGAELLSVTCAASAGAEASARHFNPIVPDWIADPSICKFGDTFYLYGTTDIDAELTKAGVPVVWKSKDFVNWSFEGPAMTGIDWAKGVEIGKHRDGSPKLGYWRYWAPGKVIRRGDKYCLYVTIVSPDGRKMPTKMFAADRPEGPWNFNAGVEVAPDIDGDAFVDANGENYLVWRRRHAAKLNAEGTAIEGAAVELPTRQKGYSEGPFLFKRDGIYYHCYTIGGCDGYRYHYMMSRESPLAGWTVPPNGDLVVESNPAADVWGPGHGNSFTVGEERYLCYLEYGEGGTTRQVFVNKMDFRPDGSIIPVAPNRTGVGYLGSDSEATGTSLLRRETRWTASSTKPPRDVIGRANKGKVLRTATYDAANVADEDNATRWMAAEGDAKPTLTADFGAPTPLAEMKIFFTKPAFGQNWKLEGSLDGTTWKALAEETEKPCRSPHVAKIGGTYRYLRLAITSGDPGVWEIRAQ